MNARQTYSWCLHKENLAFIALSLFFPHQLVLFPQSRAKVPDLICFFLALISLSHPPLGIVNYWWHREAIVLPNQEGGGHTRLGFISLSSLFPLVGFRICIVLRKG